MKHHWIDVNPAPGTQVVHPTFPLSCVHGDCPLNSRGDQSPLFHVGSGSRGARFEFVTRRAQALLPDGQTIAFFHPDVAPIWGDIWVIPAGGGQARQLTFDSREGGWPSWTPDGRFIVFSSARAGSLTLWRVPATGGTPEPLTTGAGEDTEPDISADGGTLLYGTQRKSWSLILFDPATGQEKEVISPGTF